MLRRRQQASSLYYGHRFPETDGDVTVMDWVSPYPPEFFKTEHCLITRACQPPKVYRPCTDVLPRTMAWLAAGVPTDFIDRADARMARSSWSRSNLGDYGFTQVPDPGE